MLTRAVETYLAVRRAAGFELRSQGSQLRSFAAFSEARKRHYVFTDIAIEWAGLAQSVPQRARRLGMVIRLARYLRAEDERHQVPPAVFGAETLPRPTPYILTGEQISQLITAQVPPVPSPKFRKSRLVLRPSSPCWPVPSCDWTTFRQMAW
jgi:integrase/recombinase XerD